MKLVDEIEAIESVLRRRSGAAPGQREALQRAAVLEAAALGAIDDADRVGDVDTAQRLFAGLARSLWMRGRTRVVGLAAATHATRDGSPSRGASYGAAQLHYAAAAYAAARDALAPLGDDDPDALNLLGMVEREQGDCHAADALHTRALAIYERLDDRWGVAHAISNQAVCAFRLDDHPRALTLHNAALVIRRAIDDRLGVASSLGNLALIHAAAEHSALARPLYVESLALREELGDVWGVAGSCVALAAIAIVEGQLNEAAVLVDRAFVGFEAVGDRLGFAEAAEAATALLIARSRYADAARAAAAAESAREHINAPLPAAARERWLACTTFVDIPSTTIALGRNDGDRGDATAIRAALRDS